MAKKLNDWIETDVRPHRDKSIAWISQHHFFRDPMRPTYSDLGYFFSPADGIILYQREVRPDECIVEIKGRAYSPRDALRDPHYEAPSLVIGIFMTLFDVHINRIPYPGRLSYRELDPIDTYNHPMLDVEKSILEDIRVSTDSLEYLHHNQRVLNDSAIFDEIEDFELNIRDCVRSGFCAEGCSYDAKQGTLLTYVPDAVARGVQIVHHCDVERLIFEKRNGTLAAAGVSARVRKTRRRSRENSVPAGSLQISAKLVIVSAGAIGTPELLHRSELPDPENRIGRGLVIHPSLPVIGVMEKPIENYRGIPGTIYSDAFSTSHHFYLECLSGQPVYGSVVVPGSGAEHFDVLKQYAHLAGFGIMLVDEANDANRVDWLAAEEKARIHYQLSADDQERLRFAAARAVEVMLAGGATEVLLTSEDTPRFKRAADAAQCAKLRFEPYRTTITSAHAQASVKMSEDPRLAVTNSRGESHHARNLIVCDSSSFPTSCGANPMLSIMTMARYQGRRIAGELARYEM